MRYISTRGDQTERRFCEILLEGLAPDGGLYLPTHYPTVDDATLTRREQLWVHHARHAQWACTRGWAMKLSHLWPCTVPCTPKAQLDSADTVRPS